MTARERIKETFREYTDHYDPTDVKISLKIDHTYRVAENAELIAKDLGLDEHDVFLAFSMGMLHDFGRFEQVRQYGTFIDRNSVDHAELGADLLFHDGHIRDFFHIDDNSGNAVNCGNTNFNIDENIDENIDNNIDENNAAELVLDAQTYSLIEKVIRLHNKLSLPEGLTDREVLFCNIIRDADKIDIFRVLSEVEYEDGRDGETNVSPDGARDSIMQCVREHRCVPRVGDRTEFEIWVSRYCMAFELVFPISRELTKKQGCLAKILDRQPQNEVEAAQLSLVQSELSYYLS